MHSSPGLAEVSSVSRTLPSPGTVLEPSSSIALPDFSGVGLTHEEGHALCRWKNCHALCIPQGFQQDFRKEPVSLGSHSDHCHTELVRVGCCGETCGLERRGTGSFVTPPPPDALIVLIPAGQLCPASAVLGGKDKTSKTPPSLEVPGPRRVRHRT